MTPGLISVIIPVYKDCRFLRETIDSVLSQDYQQFEILLKDDGSDNSPEILDAILPYRKDNFRYIRNEKNIGLAASRNVGISQSNGEFICFLDADDILTSRKFSIQSDMLRRDARLRMVFSDEYVIRNGERIESRLQFPDGDVPGEDVLERFVKSSFIAVFTVLVRASAFEEVGGFNGSLRWNEDDDLWFRMMLDGKVGYSDYVSGYRRLHDQNMSLNRLKMMFFQLRTFSIWVAACKKARRPELKSIVRKRSWPLAKAYFKTTLRQGKVDFKALSYFLTIAIS